MTRAKAIELIKVWDFFPEANLDVPEDPAKRTYLGLMEMDTFRLKEIKAVR
jgi:hypothetical protein